MTWLAYILDTPARQAKRRRDAYFARNPRPEGGRLLPPLTKEEEEEEWRYIMACIRADRREREREEREAREARRGSADGRAA